MFGASRCVFLFLVVVAGASLSVEPKTSKKQDVEHEMKNETGVLSMNQKRAFVKSYILHNMKKRGLQVKPKHDAEEQVFLRHVNKKRVKRWSFSIPTFHVPTINVPTIHVPTIDVPTIHVPTIDIPTIDLPTIPNIDQVLDLLPDLDDFIPDELLDDLVDDLLDDLGDALENAAGGVGDLLEDTQDFFDDVFEETGDFLGDFADDFGGVLEDIGNGLGDAVDVITDGVENVGDVIGDTWNHYVKQAALVYMDLACKLDKSKCSRPTIQCHPPSNAVNGTIYAEEGETGARVFWDDATAEGDTGIKRVYQYFEDGYPVVRSGDYFEFGAYVVIYIAEENSGQSEYCKFTFVVLSKICGVYAPAGSEVTCSYEGTVKDKRYTTWGQVCELKCAGDEAIREYRCLNDTYYMHADKKTRFMQCEEDVPASEWSAWSECSTSCGDGKQVRYRACGAGDKDTQCDNNIITETQSCKSADCPKCPSLPMSDMSNIAVRPYANDAIASFSCRQWTVQTGKFSTSRCGQSTGYQWVPEIHQSDLPSCLRTKMPTRIELQNEIAFTSNSPLMAIIKASSKHALHSQTDRIVSSASCLSSSQCEVEVSFEYSDGYRHHSPLNQFGRKKRESGLPAFRHFFNLYENFDFQGYIADHPLTARKDVSDIVRFWLDVDTIKNETIQRLNSGSLDFIEDGVEYRASRDTYRHHVHMECPVGLVPDVVYCVECPPGTHYKDSSCQACPQGSYQSDRGAMSCDACKTGHTTAKPGAKYPDECIMKCPSGTYHEGNSCEPCPLGSYQPDTGSLACVACDKDFTTTHTGTSSAEQCVSRPLQEPDALLQDVDADDIYTGLPQEVIIGACAAGAFVAFFGVGVVIVILVRRKKSKTKEVDENAPADKMKGENQYTA